MRYISPLIFSLLLTASAFSQGGGVYFTPFPADVTQNNVRLYVDISSEECNCEVLWDADEADPLYIWSWQPTENRPPLNGTDVNNGDWDDSNDNLVMKQDEDNPDLWYFDFLEASPAEFYSADPEAFYSGGIHFLVKKKDGSGDPEQKSDDLFAMPSTGELSPAGFDLELEQIATGLTRPCEIVNDGVHEDRMYIVEQPGRVRIMDLEGNIEPQPLLAIESQVNSSGNEQGLLGLAFASDFAESGHYFVNYTATQGGITRTVVSRFTAGGPDFTSTEAGSEEVVIEIVQDFGNHNGGQLDFGPDGYLYIALGDGGSGGDPNNRSQDLGSLLGKMLRIDVSELPYTIPPDNPFIDDPEALDEIWAYGLRNHWKNAFDELTGDLYMADVGQNAVEEVNFEPAGFEGGGNYGWRCYEGSQAFNLTGCDGDDYIFPVMEYTHPSVGNGSRCSITGGRVYRGTVYENLIGKYFAVDLCSGEYWVIWQENGEWQEFLSSSTLTNSLVAFGADLAGELYAVRGGLNGTIHKVRENCSLLAANVTLEENTLSVDLEGVEYVWFLDGTLLTTTTDSAIEIDENGVYNVQVTTAEGCSINAPAVDVTSLSTSDHSVQRLGLYPNPAQSELRIVPSGAFNTAGMISVSVFGTDGRLMMRETRAALSENGISLNVDALPAGFYIVRAEGEEISGSGTFVKQ